MWLTKLKGELYLSRYSDYKQASSLLKKIEEKPEDYFIIHYSSESFFDTAGMSPRVTSIAIRNFSNGQTTKFAIHEYAEVENIPFADIEEHYHFLEKKMLADYFDFVERNRHMNWVHWIMRDSNYGFMALEHRFRVLHGEPIIIDDTRKVDLSLLLKKAYGNGYIENPRMESLMNLNGIVPQNFMKGSEEAEAFKNREFVKLSFSTSAKVHLFSEMLTMAIDGKLKVRTPKWKRYGDNILGFYSMIQDNPMANLIAWAFNLLLGGIIGALISGWMG